MCKKRKKTKKSALQLITFVAVHKIDLILYYFRLKQKWKSGTKVTEKSLHTIKQHERGQEGGLCGIKTLRKRRKK